MKSGFCLSLLAAATVAVLPGCGSDAELCQKNFNAGNYGDALRHCSLDPKNPESRYIEALINIKNIYDVDPDNIYDQVSDLFYCEVNSG